MGAHALVPVWDHRVGHCTTAPVHSFAVVAKSSTNMPGDPGLVLPPTLQANRPSAVPTDSVSVVTSVQGVGSSASGLAGLAGFQALMRMVWPSAWQRIRTLVFAVYEKTARELARVVIVAARRPILMSTVPAVLNSQRNMVALPASRYRPAPAITNDAPVATTSTQHVY